MTTIRYYSAGGELMDTEKVLTGDPREVALDRQQYFEYATAELSGDVNDTVRWQSDETPRTE